MRAITYDDFLKKRKEMPYYQGRWEYMNKVIEWAGSPKSVLELGAFHLPIFPDGDVMDWSISAPPERAYTCDARKTPWQVTKHYDLFIALQVFEHLDGCQSKVWQEVKMIADKAIISLPYMWKNLPEHNINEDIIEEWTGDKPHKTYITGHQPQRIVCIFDTKTK